MVFTNEEYADMHLVYGEMRRNARAAQRRYAEKFPNRQHLTHSTFTALHQRLRETAEHEDVILMEVKENPELALKDYLPCTPQFQNLP
ncbi:helix-turn-helix domain [Holotrichia oblita]|uniref:Helix-turn-helix domain n=1 Tax=Holotrichia oblita TaxID=644536 RepID=A0ACB9T8S2_HOLOL|nr:helix-turn-helix domain [Holotrichia oblita]